MIEIFIDDLEDDCVNWDNFNFTIVRKRIANFEIYTNFGKFIVIQN